MHLRQHIGEVADFLNVPAADRPAWVDRVDAMIGRGDDAGVRDELTPRVPARKKGRPTPKDRITPFLEYLNRFSDAVRHDESERRNWPIGSGEVESIQQLGPQPRLKLPGAAWLKPNLNAIAGLRFARLSGWREDCWKDQSAA